MPASCSSYHQLQPEDRVTLASLRQQGLGVREIARVLQRSPSTLSREMRRNACEAGSYANAPAQALCRQRRLDARPLASSRAAFCARAGQSVPSRAKSLI